MNLTLKVHADTVIPETLLERIKKVIIRAETEVAVAILNLAENVTILVDTDSNMIDSNIGVGGYTEDKSQVQLSIDPTYKDLSNEEIFATLVHELSHVKRDYGPGYGTTLFDYLVFEGLGVAFEEEVCGANTYYPDHLRKLHDARELVETFSYMFDYDDTQYDYMDFILGNAEKGIPEFAVYSMGLYIIDRYLARTDKKVSELLLEQPETFR